MADAVGAGAMLMTPEEQLVHPLPDGTAELVRGALRVMPPAGVPHGRVATNLVILLSGRLPRVRHATDLVLDPARRTVMIVASDSPVRWLREPDTLNGGALVPGFSCGVAELFEGIAR